MNLQVLTQVLATPFSSVLCWGPLTRATSWRKESRSFPKLLLCNFGAVAPLGMFGLATWSRTAHVPACHHCPQK